MYLSTQIMQNGSGESCESASTSSVGSNQSHSKAPGAQLQHHHQSKHSNMFQNSLNNNNNNNGLLSSAVNHISHFPDLNNDFAKQVRPGNNTLIKFLYRYNAMFLYLNVSYTIHKTYTYSYNLSKFAQIV